MIEQLKQKVHDFFDGESSGHSIDHALRVKNIALKLQKNEGGDVDVIEAAALLHDLHRVMGNKNGTYYHPKKSLPQAETILKEINFPVEKIESVLKCIELHEEYGFAEKGKSDSGIEVKIIQDADNLDAIGAIGVARVFNYGGAHGIPMWNQNEEYRKIYIDSRRDESTIHHFYEKLLKIKDDLNTQSAKDLAKQRHEYMVEYIERFKAEWLGEI